MQWELGVKEVWEVQQPLDRVIHTMGWPLKFGAKYREFGGSFIYPMGEDRISLGLVVGLDYRDARFSVHDALQEFKGHPMIAKILEGGKRVGWGAKTIPSGGYWAMPQQLWAPGMTLVGDGAGMVNVPDAEGRPLRDARRHVRRGGDLERLKRARRGSTTSPNYQAMVEASEIHQDPTARATCASRSRRASSWAARWRT